MKLQSLQTSYYTIGQYKVQILSQCLFMCVSVCVCAGHCWKVEPSHFRRLIYGLDWCIYLPYPFRVRGISDNVFGI